MTLAEFGASLERAPLSRRVVACLHCVRKLRRSQAALGQPAGRTLFATTGRPDRLLPGASLLTHFYLRTSDSYIDAGLLRSSASYRSILENVIGSRCRRLSSSRPDLSNSQFPRCPDYPMSIRWPIAELERISKAEVFETSALSSGPSLVASFVKIVTSWLAREIET